MRVYPPEKWCIFSAAFLAADQRTRVISAPTVAGCSFPAARQIMVACSYGEKVSRTDTKGESEACREHITRFPL